MFNCVLAPLDGSAEAERALPIAARIARASGGSVALVRVVQAPAEFELGVVPPVTWAPAARSDEREEATAYLEGVRQQDILAGVPSTTAVYAGPPAAMILTAAASAGADLIVLTSHGRTGMARWLLGSVAAEVARESSAPALILRGSALADGLAAPHHTLSALVPLDGSPLAEAALAPALQLLGALADTAPVALRLLSVVQPLPLTETAPLAGGIPGEGQTLLTGVDTTMLGEAEEYLCSAAEQVQRNAAQLLPGRSISVTWTAVWNPDVAHAIVSLAEAGRAGEGSAHQMNRLAPSDLIAMATHGHGGLRRWVMGSVADRVLHATHLPLLVVRPPRVSRPPDSARQ
jgi:nucleotide-binding universal stress UspA family protein